MSRRTRYFSLVALAQACCLAVGLWMHLHFATASARHAAEEQIWSDLEATVQATARSLAGLDLHDADAVATVARQWAELPNGHQTRPFEVLIADSDWRVVYPGVDQGRSVTPNEKSRPAVQWATEASPSDDADGRVRGRITLADGPHVAAAWALDDGRGYVLSHWPVAEFEARSAALVQTWPVMSAIAFVWTWALLSIAVYLILARLHDDIDRERSQAATGVLRQTQNLVRTRDAVIFGLAKLAESRDPETGDHLDRISVYSTMMASALRRHPKFRDEITPAFVQHIGISSALHDIGKVGVEDRILRKPGPLTARERTVMKTHATIGGECLRGIEQRLGGSNFLQMAREIAFSHHENWDGRGYPFGLSGAAIPLSARIVAVADIYDALSTKRVYKDPLPHEECVAIIRTEAGCKLDPDLVEAWLPLEPRFRATARKYAGAAGPLGAASIAEIETEAAVGKVDETEAFCVASIGASDADRG